MDLKMPNIRDLNFQFPYVYVVTLVFSPLILKYAKEEYAEFRINTIYNLINGTIRLLEQIEVN